MGQKNESRKIVHNIRVCINKYNKNKTQTRNPGVGWIKLEKAQNEDYIE